VKKRGKGMAVMWYPIGPGGQNGSAARLEMDEDGILTLFIGAPDIGQGSNTALAQIAADAVGVTFGSVRVFAADSAITPPDYGSVGSRVTYMQGNSVRLAGEKMRDLLMTAKEMLKSPAADLEIVEGNIRDLQCRDVQLEVAVVARRIIGNSGKPIETSGLFQPVANKAVDPETGQGTIYPAFVYATQVAEVEVDTETGDVVILRMAAAHNSGTVINPMLIEGQIAGGIAQGIGMALTEEVKLQEGRTANSGLMDYTLPTALDIPDIAFSHVEIADDVGPYGAKCVGEPALVPTAPAILNAIHNAIGVRIYDLPATPEKILRALDAATEPSLKSA
jgi:CO/xanthine dehydrogenase Mo-binding subunit